MRTDVDDEPPATDDLDWGPVLAFLPWLREAEPEVGGFVEGTLQDDGSWSMPYESLSPRADELVATLYSTGVVAAGVDWSRWADGAGEALLSDRHGAAVAAASLEECRLLLVAHVRRARFAEGALLELFRTGGMRRILERVEDLVA